MKTGILHELLIDVRERGSACVEKKKLLWMLGRKNDGASVWAALLNEWEEIGENRSELHGVEWSVFITLVVRATDNVESVWAKDSNC